MSGLRGSLRLRRRGSLARPRSQAFPHEPHALFHEHLEPWASKPKGYLRPICAPRASSISVSKNPNGYFVDSLKTIQPATGFGRDATETRIPFKCRCFLLQWA